jgi:GGDEF domain-containing protein
MDTLAGNAIPMQDREQYKALFDPVTGLPRWALLIDRTQIALARAQRVNRKVAVFVLDEVEAFSGAPADARRFASTLCSKVRTDDTVARVAEQTFVVVCNSISRDKDAALVAQRLLQHADVVCRLGVALGGGNDDALGLVSAAMKEALRSTPAA